MPSCHHAICTIGNYHVICIVESWLCNTIANSEIELPGYTIFRRDRDRHGGGILIFVKSDISCSVIPLSCNCEFLPISVNFCRRNFCIGVFYRPPCSDISYFEDFVSAIVSYFFFFRGNQKKKLSPHSRAGCTYNAVCTPF
jgi:hypothetical protein